MGIAGFQILSFIVQTDCRHFVSGIHRNETHWLEVTVRSIGRFNGGRVEVSQINLIPKVIVSSSKSVLVA